MADIERDDDERIPGPSDDGLPRDPTARAAAVAQHFDVYRKALAALMEDTTMSDDADTAEPQPPARPSTRAAVLAALEVSGAWADPAKATHEVGLVFATMLVGQMKIDPRQIPVALAVLAQVNQHVAEFVAAVAPPSGAMH